MRKLVVKSNLLIDVGHVENGEMVCSSFGRNAYRVGQPTYRGGGGWMCVHSWSTRCLRAHAW